MSNGHSILTITGSAQDRIPDLAFAYVPHCLHIASAFQGSVAGAFKYTSRERLDFTASSEMGTTGAVLVHVVTHCHAFMHVKNGIISFEKS